MSTNNALIVISDNGQPRPLQHVPVPEQVNSLPYIDREFDSPTLQETVLALVNAEMRAIPNPVKKLSHYFDEHKPHPAFAQSSAWQDSNLQQACERARGNAEVGDEGIDLERYQQPEYAPIALEYERRRMNHLELMMQVAGEKYFKDHIQELEKINKFLAKDCADPMKSKVNDLNRRRKFQQEETAEQLKRLKRSHALQCVKNRQLQIALKKLSS